MKVLFNRTDYNKIFALNRIKFILGFLSIIFFSFALYLTVDFIYIKETAVKEAKEITKQKALSSIELMDENFTKLETIADKYANMYNEKQFSKQETEEFIFNVVKENPEVFGFLISYEPYKYDESKRLYAPFCVRKDGDIQKLHLEELYDYTSPETVGLNWYINPLNNGPGWSEPYFGTAGQSLISVYSVPFYGPNNDSDNRKPIGVVAIIYSLDQIKKFTDSLGLRGQGYSYVLSGEGKFISHPNDDYVREQKNILDVIPKNNSQLHETVTAALEGKSGLIDYQNEVTGQDSWIFFEPIPSTGYVMGIVFIKDSIINNIDITRHYLILISCFLLLGLFFLLSILFKTYTLSLQSLWRLSISLTILLLIGISFIWFLALNYNNYFRENSTRIVDESTLGNFLKEKNTNADTFHEEKPVYIDTGLFVQSMEFDSANNITITGYIWQNYDKDVPNDISRGFVMPEAVSLTAEEAYRNKVNDTETIGWYFNATLRQTFDYSKYPLDNKDVWIRIWPKDFSKNVILIPDLSSYKLTSPESKPGIEKDIVTPGWDIKESFFCYVSNSYNTNFGIKKYSGQERSPELYYTIIVTREFLNPFVSNLLPFTVMAFILFGTLVLISLFEEKRSKFGSATAGILAGCAGLFFSVLIAHNQLRSSISANGVLYLEYFYFIMYAFIIFVIIDSFLVVFNNSSFLIHYKDNLLPKLIYWPLIMSIILSITLVTFY